jgi:hypothetical protein
MLLIKAPLPAGRSKKRGKYGREGGDWVKLVVGKEGRVDRGPILLKKSILILFFLILWARRQIKLIFELKKGK